MKKYAVAITLIILGVQISRAQMGDILKRKAAEGVKQGSQTGTEKALDKGIDRLFRKKDKNNRAAVDTTGRQPVQNASGNGQDPALQTFGKYDFIPGEKILGFDDFSQDAVGDFPGKWATNASGELMTTDKYSGKWLNISKQGFYLPSFIKSLPVNFTIEYEIIFIPPASASGPNTAQVGLQVIHAAAGKPAFDYNLPRSYFELDPYMGQVNIGGYSNSGEKILTNEFQVKGIERSKSFRYHVAVWRQQGRLRVYLDERKVVDAPSLLSPDIIYNGIRLSTSLNNDGSTWLIGNFKFAAGLPDTRNKLLNEGKFSTTGILFDVNSAIIRAESYGTLKDIATVLKENAPLQVKIVGHTDSDGDKATNLDLSRRRAEAVKAALVREFSVEEGRLQTDGRGQEQPVSANSSPAGKAQNRRVEFIKL